MIALKEWAAVVLALEKGIQTLLLRKGGIVEPEGEFRLQHDEFLLYPTFEHQKRELLKPEHQYLVDEAVTAREGQLVRITSRARVLESFLLNSTEDCERVFYRHIYTEEYVGMRRAYKPDRPLYAFQLSVELLPEPILFSESVEQAGCKSWVEVEIPTSTN